MPYNDYLFDNHTCTLAIEYHICPKCKKITESRNAYVKGGDGVDRKKVECMKCKETFEVKKILPEILG